jgi:TonB family protein
MPVTNCIDKGAISLSASRPICNHLFGKTARKPMNYVSEQLKLPMYRNLVLLLLVFGLLPFSHLAAAQTPLEVKPEEATQHMQHQVGPIYPAMAALAHVQGPVLLKVEIGIDGRVINVEPISGPPILVAAASDAAREWTYTPFLLNGTPTTVTTVVTVRFNIGNIIEDKTIARFENHLAECSKALRENTKSQDTIAACRQAASAADNLMGPIYSERRMAYIYYATALLRGQQAKEAAAIADKAVMLARQYNDNSSAAYAVAGQAKAVSGDLPGADTDLERAELSEQKTLDTPVGRSQRSIYISTLKSLYQLHAQVLTALGRSADAQKKLDEASKL